MAGQRKDNDMNRRAFLKMLVLAPIVGLLARVKIPVIGSEYDSVRREYNDLTWRSFGIPDKELATTAPTFTIVNDNAGRPAASDYDYWIAKSLERSDAKA